MLRATLFIWLLVAVFAASCSVKDADKVDCGYMGINKTQCEAKGCCWVPAQSEGLLTDTPWCFYP